MRKNELIMRLVLVGIMLAPLAACASETASAELKSEKVRISSDATTQDVVALASGNAEFATDLYQMLAEEEGNLFFSPYSISAALAMTYGGARTNTQEEMEQVLHFVLGQEGTHSAFNRLDADMTQQAESEGFTLNIANAIWGQSDYGFLAEFLDLLAENYGAGLRVLDFMSDPEGSRLIINQWVEDQTEERIKDLLPEKSIDSSVRLVLTNAIYFLGKWVTPFETAYTREAEFKLEDGTSVQVPTMNQVSMYDYYQGDGFQAARLDYADSDMSMVFLLPDGQLQELEQRLSVELLDKVTESLQPHFVQISLPKFSYESELGLSTILVQMGMGSAFDDADFSGMTGSKGLFIDAVLHKAFVAVDEEGTEAAAATAVIMSESAAPLPEYIFALDHPFLYFIQDNASGTILFMGRVSDPR